MLFGSLPYDPEDSVYVFRFRKELEGFVAQLGKSEYSPLELRFFRDQARAEIWTKTKFGFIALVALIKVRGEMGLPYEAIVTSPELLPQSAKESLTKVFSGLTVHFEQGSVIDTIVW